MEKAIVKFEVDKTWLTSNNLDKNDLTILKFDNTTSKWNELKTDFDSEDDNFYYYTIELDSFSFFAIGEKAKTSIVSDIVDSVTESYEQAGETKNGKWIWWGILGFLVFGIIILSIFIIVEIRMRRKVRGVDLGHLNNQFPPEPSYGENQSNY